MALILQSKNLARVCHLYNGTIRNAFSSRLYSIYGKLNQKRILLTPTQQYNNLFKRNGLVYIRLKNYPPNKKHSFMFICEQLSNLSLVFLVPAAFLLENKGVDMAMGSIALFHSYRGAHSLIVDYVRPEVVGNILPKISNGVVIIVSVCAFAGLYQLVFDDIGLAKTIKKFWCIKGSDKKPKKIEPVDQKHKGWYWWKKD